VGTMAGQVIMQGFLSFTIPLWLRRLVTMLPALIVIALGLDPTDTLVLSQVVLSFGIPFALVPLVLFTRNPRLMGVLVNHRLRSVGTMAGQVIMQGFLSFTIPLWLRRLVTMLPALIVIALGLDPTDTLVLSQVVLSFGIPFALVPLVLFTRNPRLMGVLVNHRLRS